MTESVTVGVRIRPLNERELSSSQPHVAFGTRDGNEIVRTEAPAHTSPSASVFRYDSVFDKHSTNEQVYNDLASPIVESALGGFNATIFAYGQTSSGKTHSMLGYNKDLGITPRAIKHVIETALNSRTRQYLIRVYYVEIYNDKIKDLMNEKQKDLTVREDKAGRTFVDASETIVNSYEDAMKVLDIGQQARQVGETKMNSTSSRSHTVFTLLIESKSIDDKSDKIAFRASCLNLVDLAGSERVKSTGATGKRAKEGSHINQSLLVLGTIINKLSKAGGDNGKIGHLPYRDSKLTRLLRPALGGNSKTAILCAITPSAKHIEETISTLKFAERAKKITNKVRRNEIIDYKAKYNQLVTECDVIRERYNQLQMEYEQYKQSARTKQQAQAQVQAKTSKHNNINPMSPTPSFVSTSSSPNSIAVSEVSEQVEEERHVMSSEDEGEEVEALARSMNMNNMNYTSGTHTQRQGVTTKDDDKISSNSNNSNLTTPSTGTNNDENIKESILSSSVSSSTTTPTAINNNNTMMRKLHSDSEVLVKKEVELREARDEIKYLKAHIEEVEIENEASKSRLKTKANEFSSLRSRTIELRSIARQARTYEKQLLRIVRSSFEQLQDARMQLDTSRKKGSHVIKAEEKLTLLSEQLERYVKQGEEALKQDIKAKHERAIVLRPPGHVAESKKANLKDKDGAHANSKENNKEMEKATAIALRLGGVNENQVAGFSFPIPQVQHQQNKNKQSNNNNNNSHIENFLQPKTMENVSTPSKAYDQASTKRRPRPLPEDMVADIDEDSQDEGELAKNSGGVRKEAARISRADWNEIDVNLELDDSDASESELNMYIGQTEFDTDSNNKNDKSSGKSKSKNSNLGKSSGNAKGDSQNKAQKKSYWQQALRNFYGYGQDHNMDMMAGGHKFEGTSTSGFAR